MSHTNVTESWWQEKHEQLQILFDIMDDSDKIRDDEVLYALRYIEFHRDRILGIDCPQDVSILREALLEMMDNVYQSLDYRLDGQAYNAEVRMERALASMDTLRFHLLQDGIII